MILKSLFRQDQTLTRDYLFKVRFLLYPGLEMTFQSVSGISKTMTTQSLREGGNNTFQYQLPTGMQNGNLELKNGLVKSYNLFNYNIDRIFSNFKISKSDVIIHPGLTPSTPIWKFSNCYPIKWSLSAFDASSNNVLIENVTLAFHDYSTIRRPFSE